MKNPLKYSTRQCSVSDCTNKIRSDNKSGLCNQHKHRRPRPNAKNWPSSSPERRREANWLHMYGMTKDDYQTLIDSQSGLCPICEEPLPDPSGCNIDHDHACCPGRKSCGKCIRGILHVKCNLDLGCVEKVLRMDISPFTNYLDRWGGENPIVSEKEDKLP